MGDTSQGSTFECYARVTKSRIGKLFTFAEEKEPKKSVPFYKLFTFADSMDKILMTLGTIGAIGNGFARPLMALILGELVDAFGRSQTNDMLSQASKVSLKFVYMAFGCGIGAFLQVACWMITGQRQAARVRRLYLEAILRQEIAYFDKVVNTREVIETMTGDTFLLQDAIGEKVGTFVQVVTSFLGGFLIAFAKGWLLTLVLLSIFPLILMSGRIMNHLREGLIFQFKIANSNAANVVQRTIGSIRTIASFTGENEAMSNYKKFLTNSYNYDMRIAFNAGLEIGLHSFLTYCISSLGIWYGARLILHKGFSPGQVFTVFLAVTLGSSISNLKLAYPPMVAFTAGQVATFKVLEVINRKPTIDAFDSKGKILNNICGDIELRNVCFAYPSRPKEQIFDGFSLFIPSGTTTALVGQSGSGKSTVISLIERFYDPLSGEVLIDGINLKEFQLKWIRLKIGLVSQEPVLFSTSIRDNIAYGKDGATLEEIKAAAELANADDFINQLPQGLDTMVGELGIQLSSGQKQRVAIARAILKDPRILLLDEATSALDASSERIVQKSLEKIMVNRTTIIVAHRLSTIRNATMIVVIHKGTIVEKGTHLELLIDEKGVYSTLISSQEVNEVNEESIEYNSDLPIKLSVNDRSSDPNKTEKNNTSWSEFTSSTIAKENVISLKESKDVQEVSIFRLASLNKPEFPVLMVGTLFAIITGAISPIFSLLISSVVKAFYELPHKLEKDSKFWALLVFNLGVIAFIARTSKTYLFGLAGNKLIHRIRSKYFVKVVNMEIGWFDEPENSSGVIGGRLSNDAAKVRILVGDALGDVVHEATSITIGLAIAFEASWQLSLIVLALIPLVGFNIYVQMKSIKGFGNGGKVKYEEASQVASDTIANTRTISSLCTQGMIMEMYNKKCNTPAANEIKEGLISGIGFGTSVCLLYLVYAIIFYAGARFVQDGNITAPDIFRVYFVLAVVSVGISMSTSFATDSNKVKRAVASIFAVLDKVSQIDPSDDSSMTLENFNGEVEFKDVNFSYPTRSDVQILHDLSLTIHSGKVVALIGESGSGKSTVISLLQRFYNPNSGRITLDGIEIQKFQVKWLRQKMGFVSQEPILFNDSIRANIAIGRAESTTEAEMIAAAKLANAHDFISSLQQGYDTIVGERGAQLSGGQKQRVAIARAILKSPKILLLDEATSALDVESQKIVQEALNKVMLNKTTIIVAHRLSTIRRVDEIIVLKEGSIVERGNHNTLIDLKDGVYSSLVKLHMDVM